ncbi:GNAT family N-acetyltransferase [Acidaminobacter sp.]|uniref:GNAT family N-acetyltransferase n=1 Tax=Acidaminobacter sp. TaxID=1872102 RepID=UPI0013829C00|nr:GNAT family N-acetyltransferase [Acidaminobacter sp.]MDK9710959.1 GNAT family N-acetyltransferase [Acidaminobacter sp.]MZQ98205.1 GNAT family N-acetyltransferase [Acidaminobacter sp.]
MTNKDLNHKLKLADQNLADAILYRNKHSLHGVAKKAETYILFNLGIDSMDGHLNGALCLEQTDPETLLSEAKQFFSKDNRGFVIWVREHADLSLEVFLKEKGFTPLRIPGSTGMLTYKPIEQQKIPEGVTIRKVLDEKEIEDYEVVVMDAFNKSADVTREMFSHERILVGESVGAWVAYRDHQPIAAATMVFSGEAAGIYYVGTVADERGKGLGALMTAVATNAGFELGAEVVVLQASIAGEPVYRRLGFETITHYRWYLVDAGAF